MIKYAAIDGDFHSTGVNSIWYTGSAASVPPPFPYVQVDPPVAGDIAIANGRTVRITSDVVCDRLHNGLINGWCNFGGGFVVDTSVNTINISASQIEGTQESLTTSYCLSARGTNVLNIFGTILVPPNSDLGRNTGTAVGYSFITRTIAPTNIYGNLQFTLLARGASQDYYGGHGILVASGATLNLYGTAGVGNAASNDYNNYSVGITTNDNSTLNIYGSVMSVNSYFGGRRQRAIYVNNLCNINVYGDVHRPLGTHQMRGFQINGSSNTITINGNVYQGSTSNSTNFDFETTGSTNNNLIINGNVLALFGGVGNYCIRSVNSSSNNTITVNGNVYSVYYPAIYSTQANIFVNGNVVCGGSWQTVHVDGSGIVTINGNIIDSPNSGVPAILTNFLRFKSNSYQPYIVRPKTYIVSDEPGLSNGSLYYYPLNSFQQFSLPSIDSVRAGTVFANGALTGTCGMPPASSVYYGVPYDTNGSIIGTATINPFNLFDFNLSVYDNQLNTLGYRLANAATPDLLGETIGSLG